VTREFHSFRLEAVVLRHSDWGEADRLLVIYSREQGKLRTIAKGARKIRSRKAGHLEPFTRVALLLARSRDMPIITQAETVDAYLPLREDLILTGYAAYVIELLDRFTYESEQNLTLYDLVVDTLARISEASPNPTDLAWLPVSYYQVHLLDALGFRPELFSCASCREEIKPQDQFFSAEAGGVLCPRCGTSRAGARPVSMEVLKYLRHFQRSSYAQAEHAHPTENIKTELDALLQYYLTYLLERGLNTPAFIREVGGRTIYPQDTQHKAPEP
jgi:DNA repair protein RecO (recombination protein O)